MAKTYQDIVTEARDLLQDTEDERFTDAYLVATLNRGLQELSRIRPDAFYDLYDANALNVPLLTDSATPATGETAWTVDFGIEMQFFNPLMMYVVGSIEVTDDEFTVDGRAMMMLQQFRNSVIGI